ncbi:MAG: hypothetical protein HY293_12060 [Planctomycetes bacterium]|nr:hypothetical protein [Planctomycetota bacterium]
MPIRLCQKCGLKVLIDESQAGTNPFYCQRCTTAMKGQENAAAAPPAVSARNPTPSPVVSRAEPAAATASPGAAKAATVRVLCPYCKASFNGRVPQKPARGSCPVCQKELILLPNGDIKPAAGFDLTQYQGDGGGGKPPEPEPVSEPEPVAEAPKESGTRLLVKKYAADPPPPAARPAARRAEPAATPSPVAASAETDSSDESHPLPGWLDDSSAATAGGMVKPQPDTDMDLDAVGSPQGEGDDRTIKVEEPAPPPPPARRALPVAKQPSLSAGRPPAAVPPPPPPQLAPEPEVDLLPPEPPKRPAGRPVGLERKAPAPAPVAVADAGETGGVKVFLALILALLPVAACAGLLSSRDKLTHELVKKVGVRFSKGFAVLHKRMFPEPPPPKPVIEEKKPEPEPPKEEPPKPDPDQQKKDEAAMSTLYTQILREQRDLKSNLVGASPGDAERLQSTVGKGIEAKRERLKEKQDLYRKMYGKDYDPAKD